MITSSYKPLAGRYLISEPFMADANFQRTVILLVEHGDQGSLGFVLNKKLKVKIGEVVEDLGSIHSPVFMGGPVEQNSLHYVHRVGDKINGSREVYKGVYWGGNFEELSHLIQMGLIKNEEILFFIGYSGWSPGQLEEELERKSWIVAPKNPDFIFRDAHKELWRDILKSMGDKYQIISNYPQDPRLN